MSRLKLALIIALSLLIVVPVSALVLQPLLLKDFKSGGTAISFFQHVPGPTTINFTRGTKYVDATRTLNVEIQAAPYDPDLGVTQGPGGVDVNTAPNARPTCAAKYRGMFFVVGTNGTGDAGVADLTYQCCKGASGAYTWIAVGCQ